MEMGPSCHLIPFLTLAVPEVQLRRLTWIRSYRSFGFKSMRSHWTPWNLDITSSVVFADDISTFAIPAIVGNFIAPPLAVKPLVIVARSWLAKSTRQNQKLWSNIGSAINGIESTAVKRQSGWTHLPTNVLILYPHQQCFQWRGLEDLELFTFSSDRRHRRARRKS
jgi:hypothetical protein